MWTSFTSMAPTSWLKERLYGQQAVVRCPTPTGHLRSPGTAVAASTASKCGSLQESGMTSDASTIGHQSVRSNVSTSVYHKKIHNGLLLHLVRLLRMRTYIVATNYVTPSAWFIVILVLYHEPKPQHKNCSQHVESTHATLTSFTTCSCFVTPCGNIVYQIYETAQAGNSIVNCVVGWWEGGNHSGNVGA